MQPVFIALTNKGINQEQSVEFDSESASLWENKEKISVLNL
jgi:hypothetical protein